MTNWMQTLETQTWLLMPNSKWILLFAGVFIGFGIKVLVKTALHRLVVSGKTKKYSEILQFLLNENQHQQWAYISAIGFWFIALEALEAPKIIDRPIGVILRILLAFFALRLLYYSTHHLGIYLKKLADKAQTPIDEQLIYLGIKTLKAFVLVFGFLVLLQNLGINVVSVLAGLGLGGLALALAAQDTAANLFGSIMLILDRPFRVGDWIKAKDVEGVVEEIGLRSTRIRTFSNSLIAIPNAEMAKASIENMDLRPTSRIRFTLGVTYDTPPQLLNAFCEGIKQIIINHDRTERSRVRVYFDNYSACSLDINVSFYVQTQVFEDELESKHRIMVQVLELAKSLSIEFAFPTQTLHLSSTPEKPLREKNPNPMELASTPKKFGPNSISANDKGLEYYKPYYLETDL